MLNLNPNRSLWRCICISTVAGLALGNACLAISSPVEQSANSSRLDEKLFFALGMIESGNDDRGIGRAGEVSRYQIHPSVWRNYSGSRDYQNPDISLEVAHRHWIYLSNYFRDRSGREPTTFDMYVLWNTRFGYYARKGFDPCRLSQVVRERAGRFVNLVNR